MAEVRALTGKEFRAVLLSRSFRRGEPARNRLLLALQAMTGPRIHEALALTVDDVFDDAGRIRQKVRYRKTKQGRPREIDLPAALHPFLAAWRIRLQEQGRFARGQWLFCREDGQAFTVDQAWYRYRQAYRELGMTGCGTHSPRKLWASAIHAYWTGRMRAGENVDPLAKTARMGGWADINSCARYIGLEKYDNKSAVQEVAAMLTEEL